MLKQSLWAAFAVLVSISTAATADELPTKTVEQVFAEKATLSGKYIHISGKVVKVNNGIMGKNFLHIQDGTGTEGTNDITVTSQETAKLGDMLEIEALVTTNRDFGMGYSYPVILEEAKFTPATP